MGGFVAASAKLIQYLRFYADRNVFSAAMTPQVTGSTLKALELIKTRPEIRKKLWGMYLICAEDLRKRDLILVLLNLLCSQ